MAENAGGAPAANGIKLKLRSKYGVFFEVDKAVAMQIDLVRQVVELREILVDVPVPPGSVILMGEVEAPILAKIVEYCKFQYHLETNQMSSADVDRWEKNFVQVDKSTLFQLISAANFLNFKRLLDLTCKTVADMVKWKDPEEIRAEFDNSSTNKKDVGLHMALFAISHHYAKEQ